VSRIVSSISATNFAGYDSKRHSYLKLATLAHILQERDGSIGNSLIGAINNSPHTELKKFRGWASLRNNVSFLGQTYEAINRAPYIQQSGNGAGSVIFPEDDPNYIPMAYPIRLPAALEWTWLDQWYKPRANIGWSSDFNQTSYTANRQQTGSTGVMAFRGPPVWTFWAINYWNTRAIKLTDREKTWTGSFNPTTGIINMVSEGNWNWSFNPGIDLNAEYLYMTTAGTDMYQYRIGSGDPIMEQVAAALQVEADSGYFPFIPVTVNNISVSKSASELFEQSKKAFKKATGSKLTKLLDQIKEAPGSDEIDLGLITLGIQASSPKRFAREYIYRYCQGLRERAGNINGAFTLKIGNDTPYPGAWASESGYAIKFKYLRETVGSGLRTSGSVVKSLVWEISGEEAKLHWQVSADEWRTMTFGSAISQLTGLPGEHGQSALWQAAVTGDDTGFVFPLHEPTLRQMSRLDAIEVTQEAFNLLVGSYTLINTSSLLGGILFFVAATLLVLFPPSAAGIGLLGSNAAVGASIGLVGSAAAIAGAVINAVAAIIVMKIITKTSTLVFGDKIGAIIGAVVGFATITVGTGLMNGQSISSIWSSLGSAQNIMALTNSVGSGISGYVSAAIQDIQTEMASQAEMRETQMRELEKNYAEEFGYGNRVIDPLSLTSTMSGNYMETSQEFLTRTLLTGSDIADISLGMISSFTDLTISSALPGTN
jgi:hypothetical protein